MEAKFLVPAELPGGVYRDGVGLKMPGEEFTLPDVASPIDDDGEYVESAIKAPHHLLIPLNEDADALLQSTYGGQVPAFNLKGEPVLDKDGEQKMVADPRLKLVKRFGDKPKEKSAKLQAKERLAALEAKKHEAALHEKAGVNPKAHL